MNGSFLRHVDRAEMFYIFLGESFTNRTEDPAGESLSLDDDCTILYPTVIQNGGRPLISTRSRLVSTTGCIKHKNPCKVPM